MADVQLVLVVGLVTSDVDEEFETSESDWLVGVVGERTVGWSGWGIGEGVVTSEDTEGCS